MRIKARRRAAVPGTFDGVAHQFRRDNTDGAHEHGAVLVSTNSRDMDPLL
jgi:hypothetical protein